MAIDWRGNVEKYIVVKYKKYKNSSLIKLLFGLFFPAVPQSHLHSAITAIHPIIPLASVVS